MATIYPRKNKNGSTSWRVLIRRIGLPTFCTSFSTKKEAQEWVTSNELYYIKCDASNYLKLVKERLKARRIRNIEFLNLK